MRPWRVCMCAYMLVKVIHVRKFADIFAQIHSRTFIILQRQIRMQIHTIDELKMRLNKSTKNSALCIVCASP